MAKPRVTETDRGIHGESTVRLYDQMQRRFRDRGWMETKPIIASGIDYGLALEVGPGPGYLGLDWLKHTQATELRGVDISPDMIALAEANAREYGLEARVQYMLGDGQRLPFEDETFDAVFTNGSLHEWSQAEKTLDEIHRVLKVGGRYFISDLRRDASLPVRWFLYLATKPKEIRPGLITSLNAAYTPAEVEEMLRRTGMRHGTVKKNLIGLEVVGSRIE
jgi:ubiquinone/menaquinone biosynthesis C-methylase UbiE